MLMYEAISPIDCYKYLEGTSHTTYISTVFPVYI